MKTPILPGRIAQMAAITRMEPGKLSVIRTGPDGQPYYNLQHRQDGHNVTEYIPRDQLPDVQQHLAAYEHFKQLVDEHISEVSKISRQERKSGVKKKRQAPTTTSSPRKRKSKN
jgi:hypothetical protein